MEPWGRGDGIDRGQCARGADVAGCPPGPNADVWGVRVLAGLTLQESNGVVEGKINKLKLIKRMMYGRAEFPLLRQRVLHAL